MTKEPKCKWCGVIVLSKDNFECLKCYLIKCYIERDPAVASKIMENIKEKNNKKMQTEACTCPMFAEIGSCCQHKQKDGSCGWPR